jgi:hypothetical protein
MQVLRALALQTTASKPKTKSGKTNGDDGSGPQLF